MAGSASPKMVSLLLNAGTRATLSCDGLTALHLASGNRNYKAMQALLEKHADPHAEMVEDIRPSVARILEDQMSWPDAHTPLRQGTTALSLLINSLRERAVEENAPPPDPTEEAADVLNRLGLVVTTRSHAEPFDQKDTEKDDNDGKT